MSAATNAGPLIALSKLNLLTLLPDLYQPVLVPDVVVQEVTAGNRPDAQAIRGLVARGGLQIVATTPSHLPIDPMTLPVQLGERHAMHLAGQRATDALLPDDLVARKAAQALSLTVIGTVGIIIAGWRRRFLSVQERDAAFAEIIRRPDIWISAALVRQVQAALRAEHP